MKVLVTAFEPFGNDLLNPSEMVLDLLPDKLEDKEIIRLHVPTVFNESIECVVHSIKKHQPDAVVCLGLAKGRKGITLERIAINVNDARIPDNKGFQPKDEPIVENGPAAYFATLPIRKMEQELHKNSLEASISNSAGTFVCNHLMYGVLHYIAENGLNTRAGFIHISAVEEMLEDGSDIPYTSIEKLVESIEICIKSL